MTLKPYYSEGGVTIYLGDCMAILPQLAPDTADLLVTDPPYGVQWRGTSQRTQRMFDPIVGDDGSLDVRAAIRVALGALRTYRHVYVFGRVVWDALPLTSPVELIWDKGGLTLGDLALPWATSHEVITFGVYVPSRMGRERGSGRLAARLRQGSVLAVPRLNATAITRHPTEKPVPLLRQLIEASSVLGETVLDPFMGVGSTLVAARLEGRRAIGIEISEEYCAAAVKRLRGLGQLMLPLDTDAWESDLMLTTGDL